MFGYALPLKIRNESFENEYGDYLEQYQIAKRKSRTPFTRWVLAICFTIRTILMVVDCFRVWALGLLPMAKNLKRLF